MAMRKQLEQNLAQEVGCAIGIGSLHNKASGAAFSSSQQPEMEIHRRWHTITIRTWPQAGRNNYKANGAAFGGSWQPELELHRLWHTIGVRTRP
jgi:hypothetical protein